MKSLKEIFRFGFCSDFTSKEKSEIIKECNDMINKNFGNREIIDDNKSTDKLIIISSEIDRNNDEFMINDTIKSTLSELIIIFEVHNTPIIKNEFKTNRIYNRDEISNHMTHMDKFHIMNSCHIKNIFGDDNSVRLKFHKVNNTCSSCNHCLIRNECPIHYILINRNMEKDELLNSYETRYNDCTWI